MLTRERGRCSRDQGADRGGEPGQTHTPGGQADVGGQLRLGGVHAADDLRRTAGQQLPRLGQPDPAADPLQQLRARLGLEPGEVMADRRLRVAQLTRRRSHGSVPGHRVDDPQAGNV